MLSTLAEQTRLTLCDSLLAVPSESDRGLAQLQLGTSISGGKETNRDCFSNGESI